MHEIKIIGAVFVFVSNDSVFDVYHVAVVVCEVIVAVAEFSENNINSVAKMSLSFFLRCWIEMMNDCPESVSPD